MLWTVPMSLRSYISLRLLVNTRSLHLLSTETVPLPEVIESMNGRKDKFIDFIVLTYMVIKCKFSLVNPHLLRKGNMLRNFENSFGLSFVTVGVDDVDLQLGVDPNGNNNWFVNSCQYFADFEKKNP